MFGFSTIEFYPNSFTPVFKDIQFFLYIWVPCIFIAPPNFCFQQMNPFNTFFFLIYNSPNNYIVTNTFLCNILWSSERWEAQQFLCLENQSKFFKIPSVHSIGVWHHRTSNLAVCYLPVFYCDHHPPYSTPKFIW